MDPIHRPGANRALSTVHEGDKVIIRSVIGGRALTRRLREMGISVGVEVEVARNAGGPVIIILGNSRMALGQGMARKIMVE